MKLPERILDLGAHKGIATEYFARTFPNATIHAYEPNPRLYPKLVSRMGNYPNVRTFNEAIANHDGKIEFGVSARNVSSSIFGDEEKISVPCVSLATAVDRIGGSVFVKMDIEGAEFDVLRAIPSTVVELVGELHPEKANRTNDEMRALLKDFAKVQIGSVGKCTFHALR